MVIPTGAASLSDLQTEYGGSNPVSMNEYYAGGIYVPLGATGIASSGALNMNSFRGKNLAPNYINVATFQYGSPKYGYSDYWGWDGSNGSINSTAVLSHRTTSPKFGPISTTYTWRWCYWTGGVLYLAVNGDLRTSGPDNFRVGNSVIARTSFTRTYSSPSPAYTSMSITTSNPFGSNGTRARVTNYSASKGEPAG